MLDIEAIRKMKSGAIVLNTARGKIVDEEALAAAIKEGSIAAAAIDAFEQEPLPAASPLRELGDKVLLSSHAAAMTGLGELRGGAEWAARSVHAALSGTIPDNVYNTDVLHSWRRRFGDIDLLTRVRQDR